VTPFGELIADAARGTLMGNRGCLHDETQHIRRSFVGRRWIACVLAFKGRRRKVMAPGRYTELFFLDEATALAAGHRPCAECQRERYLRFREDWMTAAALSDAPSVDDIDRALHAERLDRSGGKRTYVADVSELPSGVIVANDSRRPYLICDRTIAPWTPSGYGRAVAKPRGAFAVLTPRSIVRVIAAGFPVGVHPSAPGDE
jgi:hypothetical protein